MRQRCTFLNYEDRAQLKYIKIDSLWKKV